MALFGVRKSTGLQVNNRFFPLTAGVVWGQKEAQLHGEATVPLLHKGKKMAFIPSTAERGRIRLPPSFLPSSSSHRPRHRPFLSEEKRWEGEEDPPVTGGAVGFSFFGFYQPMGVRTLLVQLHVRAGASRLATASSGGRKQRHLAQGVCDALKGRQKGRRKSNLA